MSSWMSNLDKGIEERLILKDIGITGIRARGHIMQDQRRNQFGRQPSNPRLNQNQSPNRANTSSPSAHSPSSLVPPNLPLAPGSPSLTATNMQSHEYAHLNNQGAKKNPPFFFRDEYAGFIVKGNFGTLSVKPQLVDEGEWIAHQVAEQNRLLTGMVKIVQTEERVSGRPICNELSCPTMSAGSTTYTWIDTSRNPINLPAATYIKHIQTWVAGKIQDEALFPTVTFQSNPPALLTATNDPNYWLGKSSGFPQKFEVEIKNMYKQMFRCYAHLYWSHWLNFWDLNCYRELNTCFVHFVNVGKLFDLLSDKDTEPMQPLIELWTRNGHLPKPSSADSVPAPNITNSTASASVSAAASASESTASNSTAPAPQAPAAAAGGSGA